MKDCWYKNTVIYALDVETFADSDGDGIGDFQGLRDRLDYLCDLGVGCLWLTPFYPTPNQDNGYDITEYCAIDPRLGTMADFDAFCVDAHDRGLRVIVDLVVNHTSEEHPWFQSARRDPASPYRPFYAWSRTPEPAAEATNYRDPNDKSVWTFDDAADRYYRHQFYEFQPDLANGNPEVQQAINVIMGFWLDKGIDGFRVDAARHLGGKSDGDRYEASEPHRLLREMRRCSEGRQPSSMLMGESNAEPAEVGEYFGEGDELQMIQNFSLDNYLMLALARERSAPIARVLAELPEPPSNAPCQWANFLRNFDELQLGQLEDDEREEVFAAFAPDDDMRIYSTGIRRRMAPMLHGDIDRLALAYSLLLTLPGSPIILYGDEIGMGENLSLPERQSVRTPMQWSIAPNGGFSSAAPEQTILPVIDRGPFAYHNVNVAAALAADDSLLNRLKRGIAVRRKYESFGAGLCGPVDVDNPAILVHRLSDEHGVIVAVHNLGQEPCEAVLKLEDEDDVGLMEIHANRNYPTWNAAKRKVQVDRYGYRWFWRGPTPDE